MNKTTALFLVLIAATAAGLCIPAIQKTREAAARTQCINNLKQFGVSLHAYHDWSKRFPRAIAGKPTKELPPERQLSWLWVLDPFIESRMGDKFNANPSKPWDDPENAGVAVRAYGIAQCPANPNVGDALAFTHYVGITGVGKDAAWLPDNDPNAGIFGYNRVVTLKDITDGTSTTMMIAETGNDNGPWPIGGYTTARGIDRDDPDYLGMDGQFLTFHRPSTFFYFKSVTQVLMVDGTVRGLTNQVSDDVFEALATYAGGEKVRAEDLDR